MTLYELINSAAFLFIIGLEVHGAMRWTRAKINDWKWFTCITLLCCCCRFCALVRPLHMQNCTFKNYRPFLTNNDDYWGTPELSTESSVGELGCPPSCRGQHSQPGFSTEKTENPPEVFSEDNKPFLCSPPPPLLHCADPHVNSYWSLPPVPSTAAHAFTLLNCLPGKILFLCFCLHPCKLKRVNYKIAQYILCTGHTINVWRQQSSYLANVRGY